MANTVPLSFRRPAEVELLLCLMARHGAMIPGLRARRALLWSLGRQRLTALLYSLGIRIGPRSAFLKPRGQVRTLWPPRLEANEALFSQRRISGRSAGLLSNDLLSNLRRKGLMIQHLIATTPTSSRAVEVSIGKPKCCLAKPRV